MQTNEVAAKDLRRVVAAALRAEYDERGLDNQLRCFGVQRALDYDDDECVAYALRGTRILENPDALACVVDALVAHWPGVRSAADVSVAYRAEGVCLRLRRPRTGHETIVRFAQCAISCAALVVTGIIARDALCLRALRWFAVYASSLDEAYGSFPLADNETMSRVLLSVCE